MSKEILDVLGLSWWQSPLSELKKLEEIFSFLLIISSYLTVKYFIIRFHYTELAKMKGQQKLFNQTKFYIFSRQFTSSFKQNKSEKGKHI